MASNSVTSATTGEESEWIEMNCNFERGYRIGENVPSSKNTDCEKAGILDRISGRAYKEEKRKNSELNVRITTLEKENADLKEQFLCEIQKQQEQQRNLHAILTDCSNIQLGDGNTIKIFEYDPDMEDPIPMIKILLDMMRDTNDQMLKSLTESENKLTQNNIYLQKIHAIVEQLQEKKETSAETQMIDELKETVDIAFERDGWSSLEEAFDSLKVDKTVIHFEQLKPAARRGIRFIVYHFGSTTIKTFASVLGQQFEMQQMQSQDCLDEESSCVMILNWLRTHENNVQELIDILRGFNDQSIQGKLKKLKEETFVKLNGKSGKGNDVEPEISPSLLHLRKRPLCNSVISLRSNRSDISEALENISKHVSETLHKAEENPPDTNALLCAVYSLLMDNTKMLQAVSEKVGASDVYVDNPVKDMKPNPKYQESDVNYKNSSEEEDGRVEKYV